ncbi:hypothetical protein [Streptomyces sp. NBC_00122]|uniref:hypothetical protein n=1 Tax=Streptomyces sp. NBC_00122 TaxID=2903623 RepID=UPI00324DD229
MALVPRRTLAVVAGASAWPSMDGFPAAAAFARSSRHIVKYLTGSDHLALPTENLLDLFDLPNSREQYASIDAFFSRRQKDLGAEHGKGLLVLFFYLGHGAFFGPARDYCLLVHDTQGPLEDETSLRVASLGRLMKARMPLSARILVLDCCFAAEAARTLQGPLDEVVTRKTEELLTYFPADRGVALLCAASAHAPARLENLDTRTLFNRALVDTLKAGDPEAPGPLTLRRVCTLTGQRLAAVPDAPRPEVHVPDQASGDLASVPLFPNPAAPTAAAPAEPAERPAPVYPVPADFGQHLREALEELGPVRNFHLVRQGISQPAVDKAVAFHGLASSEEVLAVWQTHWRIFGGPESLVFTRAGILAKDPSGTLDLGYDSFPDSRFSAGHDYFPDIGTLIPGGHYYRLEVEHPGGRWHSRWLDGRKDVKNTVNLLKLIQRLKS